MEDLYRLLGLSRRANGALIKSTYYQLAKRFHPDTNFGHENGRIREIILHTPRWVTPPLGPVTMLSYARNAPRRVDWWQPVPQLSRRR